MNETKYYVQVEDDVVAENLTLEYATLLMTAIFERYFNDTDITVTIARMDRSRNCYEKMARHIQEVFNNETC